MCGVGAYSNLNRSKAVGLVAGLKAKRELP